MMVHFLRPWGFLWAIPALWLWFRMKHHTPHSIWSKHCSPVLLKALLPKHSPKQQRLKHALLFSALTLYVLIMAGPSFGLLPHSVFRVNHPRVLLVDLSDHMNQTDLPPTRMQRAQYKIQDFLALSHDSDAGLVAFTQYPFVASPLTQDAHTLKHLIPMLTPAIMPIKGPSNIGKALLKGKELLNKAQFDSGDLVVLTGEEPTTEDLQTAHTLKTQHIHTHVLDLGHTTQLSQLAKAGGGVYQRFSDDDQDLQAILESTAGKKLSQSLLLSQQHPDKGALGIVLLLLLGLWGIREGWCR